MNEQTTMLFGLLLVFVVGAVGLVGLSLDKSGAAVQTTTHVPKQECSCHIEIRDSTGNIRQSQPSLIRVKQRGLISYVDKQAECQRRGDLYYGKRAGKRRGYATEPTKTIVCEPLW